MQVTSFYFPVYSYCTHQFVSMRKEITVPGTCTCTPDLRSEDETSRSTGTHTFMGLQSSNTLSGCITMGEDEDKVWK